MKAAASSPTSPRPRIVYLDHAIEAGGAELALKRLVWDPVPWEVTVILPGRSQAPSGDGVFSDSPSHVRVLRQGSAQQSGATESASLRRRLQFISSGVSQAILLRRSAAFRAADVIYANTSRAAVYGALSALTSRKPLVLHLRDFVTVDSLGPLGHLFFRLALKRADGVVANSNATLATAKGHLRKNTSVAVIPSPIGEIIPTSYATNSEGALRIGMVARIDRWKGHELLLEAFAREFSGGDCRLILAGSPAFGKLDYLEELKLLARTLGIESQVEFLGHVEDISAVIQTFDICVQASIRPEPLGQNVLQYLAAARPTIAADQGGPVEWIAHGKTGLLFNMGSVDDLALTLRQLANDPALRQSLAAMSHTAIDAWTPRRIQMSHLDFYETVLASRRRPFHQSAIPSNRLDEARPR